MTVVAGERGISGAALRFAVDAAARSDSTLVVSRSWGSLHEGPAPAATWLAHQQEELDGQLADWQARYPHVPMSARLELGDDWLAALRDASSLVVAGRDSARAIRSAGASAPTACPTVVVPDDRPIRRA